MAQQNAMSAMVDAYNIKRRLRNWSNAHFGGMQAAKLHPLSMCKFNPDEGGTVQTQLNVKLAPVSGHMRSKAYVEVVQIFAPLQAIEKLDSDDADAGVTEMTRRRLLEGTTIGGLGGENQISKACNIHPKKVGGAAKVDRSVFLAYNAAVNHLRLTKHHEADLLDDSAAVIVPAVLSATVLDRFDGVLDPEKLVDGAISLTGSVPVKGIGVQPSRNATDSNITMKETGWETSADHVTYPSARNTGVDNQVFVRSDPVTGEPEVMADLTGTTDLTLRDMVESYKLDGLIRDFAQMIQDDPVHGEEKVARALYGLSVDYDATCQVMYRKVHELTAMHRVPMDGPSANDVNAHFELDTTISTLVPRSELGGQLVTLVSVKPLEMMAGQPDPHQTKAFELVNRIHDETQLDEVLVTRKDVESDVANSDADTPVFWTGHNRLLFDYRTQGPNAQQVANTEVKSSMWIYEIPSSVTPENVSYPGTIDMYPFYNWDGAHAEYTIMQNAVISTTLAKGPTPVERIQLFHDDPTLVNEA